MTHRAHWFSWLLMSVALLAFIGRPAVQRTQEARVLETAREMQHTGFSGWMIPRLNNELRLKKPPLAYWMAGAAFVVNGVNETAGRVPFAICGWLTIGVIAWLTSRPVTGQLSDRSTALLAVLLLGGCTLFVRNMRLSETDAPATLFVTTSIALIIAAIDLPAGSRRRLAWNGAAVLAGLAAMAKGGPVVFPIAFVVAASIAVRRNLLGECFRSGAPLTLAIVALPWFIGVAMTHGLSVVAGEMHNNLSGGDHGAPPYAYLPWLITGLLPWTIAAVVALVSLAQAAWQKRATPFEKLLIAWILSIAVPLMLTGNKQQHYLLPLMPPIMIATAMLITQASDRLAPRGLANLGATVLAVTAIAVTSACVAAVIMLQRRHILEPLAAAALLCIVIVAVIALVVLRSSQRAAWLTLTGGLAALMGPSIGLLLPTFTPHDPRAVASEIRARFGDAPLAFYGPNISLSLCFNLRQAIPQITTADELARFAADHPGAVAIAQTKSDRSPPPAPSPFEAVMPGITTEDQIFNFYRAANEGSP